MRGVPEGEGVRQEGGHQGGEDCHRHVRAVRRDHRAVGLPGISRGPVTCPSRLCRVYRHVAVHVGARLHSAARRPGRRKPDATDALARRPQRFRSASLRWARPDARRFGRDLLGDGTGDWGHKRLAWAQHVAVQRRRSPDIPRRHAGALKRGTDHFRPG